MSNHTNASDSYMLQFAQQLAAGLSATRAEAERMDWALVNLAISVRATMGEFAVRNQYCHPPDEVRAATMEWLLVRGDAAYLLVLEPLPRVSCLQPHYSCATPSAEPESLMLRANGAAYALSLYNKFAAGDY